MSHPINRIAHLIQGSDLEDLRSPSAPVLGPTIDIDALERGFQDLHEEEIEDVEILHSSADDEDLDEDLDGHLNNEDDAYLADKLAVAHCINSVLTEARIIFQKDSKTGKVFLIARLDEMDLPDHFSPDGDEMFRSDIMIRILEKAYSNPRQASDPIDGRLFKKKNWKNRR